MVPVVNDARHELITDIIDRLGDQAHLRRLREWQRARMVMHNQIRQWNE
jgi:hypothetical protein